MSTELLEQEHDDEAPNRGLIRRSFAAEFSTGGDGHTVDVRIVPYGEQIIHDDGLGGLPKGATLENAMREFRVAAQLDPGYVHHHLELGRTLLMMRRYADARRELEIAATLPPYSSDRDAAFQGEARRLLAKLPKQS